jgi:hypothetical protein
MDSKGTLSIWLVVGISLLGNGLLILVAGVYEWIHPPEVITIQMFDIHAPIWWGAILAAIGLGYCVRFRPSREAAE